MDGQEWSDERVVHGERYRWNYVWSHLEKYHVDVQRWEKSAFNAMLTALLQGEPYSGLEGDREKTFALFVAFVPIFSIANREIEKKARAFVHNWIENIAVGHPEEITVAWLMERHPELSAEEAEEYRLFLKAKTFVFRGCYGEGTRFWTEWQAFKNEIGGL